MGFKCTKLYGKNDNREVAAVGEDKLHCNYCCEERVKVVVEPDGTPSSATT
jgi:hypothetical protein